MRKQILSASHCTGFWMPSLNKGKSVNIQEQFLEQRMKGIVLFYQVAINNQSNVQCLVSVRKNERKCVILSSWH